MSPSSDANIPKILILNYGSQYADLILKRCRECSVYHELHPFNTDVKFIEDFKPRGIILSGGPNSVYDKGASILSPEVWKYAQREKIPILGICYGMQDMHQFHKAKVDAARCGEFGPTTLQTLDTAVDDPLFASYPKKSIVWMSHQDIVTSLAPDFKILATTHSCEIAAASCVPKLLWSVQFHPEVMHSEHGGLMFQNFIHRICKIPLNTWTFNNFCELAITSLRKEIGSRQVYAAISGGVDSAVAAALVHKAVNCQCHGFIIETGLLRKNEVDRAVVNLKRQIPGLDLQVIHAHEDFFNILKSVKDPESKRLKIGEQFARTLTEVIKKMNGGYIDYDNCLLLQGTICPDVIESFVRNDPKMANKSKIKTHHNVGGLPEDFKFQLLEPLKKLFKDEVRNLGLTLGLDESFLRKQPFPGPGLAVRIIGEVTPEKVSILQKADAIFMDELDAVSPPSSVVSQAFVVLIPDCLTVGVKGDSRTLGMTAALRAVQTSDFMTAKFCPIPYDVLEKISCRITNEINQITRVVYDITSKPPGTIEWE